ncbi:MAG: GDSL-type esterase/lipase family protein, partial [Chloroflexota bacterium]
REIGRAFPRGEPIAPKQPDEYRIVAVGASTTYGFGLETAEEAYPAQLEQALHDAGQTEVKVVNAGVPSYTTWESTANLAFRVVDLQPDLVIIYHAGNDVGARMVDPAQYTGLNAARGTWQHYDEPLPRSAIIRLVALNNDWMENPLWYETYLETATPYMACDVDTDGFCTNLDLSALDVLEQNPPVYFERNLKTMIAIARIHGSDVMLSTWAYDIVSSPEGVDTMRADFRQQGVDEHNAVTQAIADEFETLFFDLADVFPSDPELWIDGVHLTAEGTQLQAELYADYLLATVFAQD